MNPAPDPPPKRRFSDIIDIRRLERENRPYLALGCVVAVIVHLIAGAWLETKLPIGGPPREPEPVRSIPVELIVLPPRIRNPYDGWKRETPERKPERSTRPTESRPGAIPAKPAAPFEGHTGDYEVDADVLVEGILNAPVPNEVFELVDPPRFTIPYVYDSLTIEREPLRRFSLRDELLTVDDIDGLDIYRGFVIEDPDDKRNLKGFLYIPRYITAKNGIEWGYGLTDAVPGLAEAFNMYTGVRVSVDDSLKLDSDYLHNYPLVYLTTTIKTALHLDKIETKNLGDYLRRGGFAIIDNGRPWQDISPAEATLFMMLFDALGRDIRFDPLPSHHPVYHCYFDFAAPPVGFEDTLPPTESVKIGEEFRTAFDNWGDFLNDPDIVELQKRMAELPRTVWGVWLGERLVAVYCDKGYGYAWRNGVTAYKHRDTPAGGLGATQDDTMSAQMRFGINLLVYALRMRDGKSVQYTDWSGGTSR